MTLLEKASQLVEGVKILAEWIGRDGHVVSQVDAQRRADICMKCPMNGDGIPLAETVADVIRRTVEVKNHLQLRVNSERSLHTCSACSCALRLKIWLPIERIKPTLEEVPNYDANCWLLEEMK